MNKTFVKKTVDELCRAFDEKVPMKDYEIAELSLKTCMTQKGEVFVHAEATLQCKDRSKGCDYTITKDFDL